MQLLNNIFKECNEKLTNKNAAWSEKRDVMKIKTAHYKPYFVKMNS